MYVYSFKSLKMCKPERAEKRVTAAWRRREPSMAVIRALDTGTRKGKRNSFICSSLTTNRLCSRSEEAKCEWAGAVPVASTPAPDWSSGALATVELRPMRPMRREPRVDDFWRRPGFAGGEPGAVRSDVTAAGASALVPTAPTPVVLAPAAAG